MFILILIQVRVINVFFQNKEGCKTNKIHLKKLHMCKELELLEQHRGMLEKKRYEEPDTGCSNLEEIQAELDG